MKGDLSDLEKLEWDELEESVTRDLAEWQLIIALLGFLLRLTPVKIKVRYGIIMPISTHFHLHIDVTCV